MRTRVEDYDAKIDDKRLLQAGSLASLVIVLLIPVEIIFFALYPQPSSVAEWFNLFQHNRLVGLLDFWGFEVPMYLSFILVFLSLNSILKRGHEGSMHIATTLILVGVGVFLATNNPFSMLTLSNQYSLASTDPERAALLSAGQAVLVGTNQRVLGGFNVGLFLVSIGGLLVSLVMRNSGLFSGSISRVGIVAFGLSLADYAREAFTSDPLLTLLLVLTDALFLAVWFALVGRELYRSWRTSPGNQS